MSEVNASAPVAQESAPASAESTESQSIEQSNSPAEGQSVADLQDAAANGTPAEQKAAKKMLKELQIKYNGKVEKMSLPFEIPDDEESRNFMTKHLQMSKQGNVKAQEYNQLESEVRSFIEELRKNPRKVLTDPSIGIDLKKMAAELIEEEIANSQKTPEQLEKEKLEAELKAMKEEREKEKEESKKREFERIQQESFERYDMMITQALDKSDLPKSPYVVKKMADYMLMGLQQGIDVTAEDVLPLIRDEIQGDLKEMFAVMPEEVIEAIIGKDVFTRVRKKNIAAAKAAKAPPTAQQAKVDTGVKTADEKPKQKQSFKDFFNI